MLHINIGKKSVKTSFCIELAYWNFSHSLPYSYDIGIERQKSKWRIYSEIQTGIVYCGFSAGPCLEIIKDSCCKIFLQSSVWANAFLGLDFRFSFSKGEHYFSPGVYAKYPFTPNGWDSFNKEFDKNHNNTNNNVDKDFFHHHH